MIVLRFSHKLNMQWEILYVTELFIYLFIFNLFIVYKFYFTVQSD